MDCETDVFHIERTWLSSEDAHCSYSNVDAQKMICDAYGLNFYVATLGLGSIQFYQGVGILVFKWYLK